MLIAFPSDTGLNIIHPISGSGLTPQEVAFKDVPDGVPFKFIQLSDLPSDRKFRGAWEVDFSQPDGYGMGADKFWASKKDNQ
jgi:hypothetical protein